MVVGNGHDQPQDCSILELCYLTIYMGVIELVYFLFFSYACLDRGY
jgi:hypothetical protein